MNKEYAGHHITFFWPDSVPDSVSLLQEKKKKKGSSIVEVKFKSRAEKPTVIQCFKNWKEVYEVYQRGEEDSERSLKSEKMSWKE